MHLRKIISGGQTGADRAALDVALEHGIDCGGWCPRGRLAQDGPIAMRYPLEETESSDYKERTALNVKDSDGTLICTVGPMRGGTLFTAEIAKEVEKPFLVIDCQAQELDEAVQDVIHWLERHEIEVLNVAGPRASNCPGIYQRTQLLIEAVCNRLA